MLDGDGNAASLSCSTGSGSGVVVPGTGIYLNNMLGEFDLVGAGAPPPRRAAHEHDGADRSRSAPAARPRLVVGSAGSARLRGAIMQVVVNVLEHGLGVAAAIEAPRIHLDEPLVHCEGGHDPEALALLAAPGYPLARWRRRNLFFGGAAAVERLVGRNAARPPATRGAAAPGCSSRERLRVRPAVPGDAAALVALAAPSPPSRRAGCSPTRRWRSAGEERRYIRAVYAPPRRGACSSPSSTATIVGRLSLMRDPHPASAPRRRPRAHGRGGAPPARHRLAR